MKKRNNDELGRLTVEGFRKADKAPVVIVLDNIRSLNNVGSVFRTADAFRVSAVYLCGITGVPPHREIQKTALGATESVEWHHFERTGDALMELKESGYRLTAVEQVEQSISLERFVPQQDAKYAFVFGNEIHGVSEDVLGDMEGFIEIPQFGTKHSFNVVVSAGIVLWHYFLKTTS